MSDETGCPIFATASSSLKPGASAPGSFERSSNSLTSPTHLPHRTPAAAPPSPTPLEPEPMASPAASPLPAPPGHSQSRMPLPVPHSLPDDPASPCSTPFPLPHAPPSLPPVPSAQQSKAHADL